MTASSSASESLPPLYAAWVAELLNGPIPRESRATCDECAMCAHGQEEKESAKDYFDSTIKCCTYVPRLHNFLAGRILSDNDPASAPGRATVEKRIQDGVAVTPLGLAPPPTFSLLYENSTNAFGRSRNLRCPHYLQDGGRCGVWRHRESTCATWFCKHVRGNVGYTFWQESLHPLLAAVENDLAHWSVLELGLDDEALRRLSDERCSLRHSVTGESIDNRVDRETYAGIWGKWHEREGEFFIECARLVERLSWTDVLSICGPEARLYARLTAAAYQKLVSDEIPPSLKVGVMQLVQIKQNVTRVCTYSAFDPLDLPSVVMQSLGYFDGRPTAEAMAAIAAEKDIRMELSLVRKLVDFALLVPPEK